MANWIEINSVEEWKEKWASSSQQPILVFKHSTACPVSAEALREFEQYVIEASEQKVGFFLVKVIESRPVSNQIAEDSQLKHESPQAILFENEKVIWNASHWKITKESLQEAIK
ncbi:bacillithiol system redox-active protein YtxJ [Ammoniphilus sp. YIM 78166]|uniref:bacillithiol system redox-active protein YtxJ n=1 Tax=Ammoniphilus sp. YIM 78166 TaxID=1644106 RepID=UPI00106F5265|nr:bacillithiol system redox-active protein YtxJ [Ammoniphilus sp. YIM 78166]